MVWLDTCYKLKVKSLMGHPERPVTWNINVEHIWWNDRSEVVIVGLSQSWMVPGTFASWNDYHTLLCAIFSHSWPMSHHVTRYRHFIGNFLGHCSVGEAEPVTIEPSYSQLSPWRWSVWGCSLGKYHVTMWTMKYCNILDEHLRLRLCLSLLFFGVNEEMN